MILRENPYFWASLAVLLWSTVATAFKIALDYLSPMELVVYATTCSAIALVITCFVQNKASQCPKEFIKRPVYYLLSALLNPISYYFVLFGAYSLLPGSQAQPINYTWAISLTILSAIFLKRPIRKRDGFGCFLGYAGVFIIATQGNITSFQFDSSLGVFLALLSTFLWSAYWILNARVGADATVSLTISFCIASILLWVFLGHAIDVSKLTSISASAVVYIGLFEMGITFLFWSKAMKLTTNTSVIANLIFLSPFISLTLLYFVRDEIIYPSTIIGLVIIIIALLIQQVSFKNRSIT
ncbi:DMT family transporter [Glaciecola sp. MF2-115]|uniref:DMT family transporter n=1 Tax=Glaciecola sp. MF2-115 TaxID=3384827 RepID=UPI0039A03BBF